MTESELRRLAIDFLAGRVFGSWDIRNDDMVSISTVFLPLVFGAKMPKDIGACYCYEYTDKAGPQSVNGYPTFFSMRILTKSEFDRFIEFTKEQHVTNEKRRIEDEKFVGVDKNYG